MPPPRYLPDVPFPPYAFVPGQNPHPISDSRGHSHGIAQEPAEPLDPERWQECRAYLRGVDLFNHGYYWEAHEAWESLWHVCGRTGARADFLKGLIKLAAAGVKNREGKLDGVKSHARRADELFRGLRNETPGRYLGLQLTGLIELAESVAREGWPTEAPQLLPSA